MRRTRAKALAAISALFLAACGGGGGGSAATDSSTGPAPSGFGTPITAPPPVVATPSPPTSAPPPAPPPAPPSAQGTSVFGSPVLHPMYASGARTAVDRPDDFQGEQFKVVYAVPRGGVDQQLDVTSRIPYSLAAVNRWLEAQIGRKVRFDTFQGDLDIAFVQLPKTDAEYSTPLKFFDIYIDVSHLERAGKNLLVFYDGPGEPPGVCGRANLGSVGQSRLQSLVYITNCWSTNTAATPDAQPNWNDFLPLHEIFHALGANHLPMIAQPADPTTEGYRRLVCDLMYTANDCTFDRWILDPYGLHYYSPSGFADGRANTYDSPFLTPPRPR